MAPRNHYLHQQNHQQSGESFTTSRPGAKEDNVPPPKIAPPVFISVPPPLPPSAPGHNGHPVPPMRSRPGAHGGPPFGPPGGRQRNAPVRSQSMSIADLNRFHGSPPLPRFRPPPPPGGQRNNGNN